MTKFGQIFYGRSRDGYGILGASPLGRPYVGFVAALCRAVGSPDRPGGIQPFLISKREGGTVIMIRACRGDADPTGRSTLFFHALVAPVDVLSPANLDAFVLAEKGVFLSTLSKSVDDFEVSVSTGQSGSPPFGELRFPAFVSSNRPLDAEVRRALGRETLTRNWATYSYRPLDGFDLCVHSSYASSPTSGNRYTLENGRFVAIDGPCVVSPTPQPQKLSRAKVSLDSSLMLKASLFVNAILVIGLIVVLALYNGKGNDGQPPQERLPSQVDKSDSQKPNSEMTKKEAFEKWGREWEIDFKRSLCMSFEKCLGNNRRILDFEKEMLLVDLYYEDYKNKKASPPTSQTLDIYAALKAYVSFVETEVITRNQERKNDENNKSKR